MTCRPVLLATVVVAGWIVMLGVAGASPGEAPAGFVLIKGGAFKSTKSNYYGNNVTVSDFYIGKYAVTQKEWLEVMGSNPAKFRGERLPVEMVSWYDSIQYCNRRSIKEGLRPYYSIDRAKRDPDNQPDPRFGNLDDIKWTVTLNPGANGYRLPTEAEWEYAASGGQQSRNYTYSGSDVVDEVAWYWRNSGDANLSGAWSWPLIERNHDSTKPVGEKKPNELGLYDMSGNVRQWCWDWQGGLPVDATDPRGSQAGFGRVWRGGGWIGDSFSSQLAYRGRLAPNGKGPDQGLRLARSK